MSNAARAPHLRIVPDVWIGEDEGQIALLIRGVVQSVVVDHGPLGPGYWPLMLPDARPKHALILGLGGGTLAHLLSRRFPGVGLTAVEINPDVIRLARSAFSVDNLGVEIVEGDAFEFIAKAVGSYDFVAVDLFAEGQIPRQVFQKPFVRRVKDLLTPGGVAAFNFFKDRNAASRLRRLGALFPHVEVRESRENVVAMCRPR